MLRSAADECNIHIQLVHALVDTMLSTHLSHTPYSYRHPPIVAMDIHPARRHPPVRVLALLDFTLSSDVSKCGSLVQHYQLQLVPGAASVAAEAALMRLPQLSDLTIVQLSDLTI